MKIHFYMDVKCILYFLVFIALSSCSIALEGQTQKKPYSQDRNVAIHKLSMPFP